MDYRLFYTQKALNDLAEIIGHIAEDDSEAASRFGTSLLDHVELLARFPNVRKLVHSPIVIYYRIHERKGTVEILHFRHSARKPPRSER